MKSFSENLNGLSQRYGVGTVFSDMMTMIICALSMQKEEELYFKTIKPYNLKEMNSFSEAFASLVIEMTGKDTGFIDVLGEFFMEFISHGRNGQFFTPMNICNMMAQMTNPVQNNYRLLDPACGSGRMLMSAAKINRTGTFFGADCDATCAKMTVINMALNTMYGEVAWMDSLSNKWYGGWKIEQTIYGIACIRKITEEESYIHMSIPKLKEIPSITKPLPQIELLPSLQSQLVFDF